MTDTKTDRCRRYYELNHEIPVLEAEKTGLRELLVSEFGTGDHLVGPWKLSINSFDQSRLDRKAAEAVLGSLEAYEKATPTLRVQVKPQAQAIVDLLQ